MEPFILYPPPDFSIPPPGFLFPPSFLSPPPGLHSPPPPAHLIPPPPSSAAHPPPPLPPPPVTLTPLVSWPPISLWATGQENWQKNHPPPSLCILQQSNQQLHNGSPHQWSHHGRSSSTPEEQGLQHGVQGHLTPERQAHWASHGTLSNDQDGRSKRKSRPRKPPVYTNFCDTCDRGFKNPEAFDEHVSQHVKCKVDDCKFSAHEKLVKFHFAVTHARGGKRIKLDTPEEIAKWREDRRRNFPTRANIERKKALAKARNRRGEVLTTAQFGKMRRLQNSSQRKVDDCNQQGRPHSGNRGTGQMNESTEVSPSMGLPNAKTLEISADPLNILVETDTESDQEEKKNVTGDTGLTIVPRQMTSALASLVANYVSSSDSEPEELPARVVATPLEERCIAIQDLPKTPGKNDVQEIGGAGANVRSRNRNSFSKKHHRYRHRNHRKNEHRQRLRESKKRHPTLLEMLLAGDIRHERNVLLQCIRYIIHNNFFGLHQKSEAQCEALDAVAVKGTEEVTDLVGDCKSTATSDPGSAGGHSVSWLEESKSWTVDQASQKIRFFDEEIWETPTLIVEEKTAD